MKLCINCGLANEDNLSKCQGCKNDLTTSVESQLLYKINNNLCTVKYIMIFLLALIIVNIFASIYIF